MAGTDRDGLLTRLRAGLGQMELTLTAEQTGSLVAYLLLLERWNKSYNLTGVRNPLEMVPKHLLDSLSVLPYLLGDKVLDVGTGSGLPGIPLAITRPEWTFCLLDSNGKKIRFLRQAKMELALGNVSVIQARMESYLPGRKFATIVSRGVGWGPDLSSAAGRLRAHPARLLTMKGRRPDEAELRALDPGPDSLRIHRLKVPFLDAERHLIEARYD